MKKVRVLGITVYRDRHSPLLYSYIPAMAVFWNFVALLCVCGFATGIFTIIFGVFGLVLGAGLFIVALIFMYGGREVK